MCAHSSHTHWIFQSPTPDNYWWRHDSLSQNTRFNSIKRNIYGVYRFKVCGLANEHDEMTADDNAFQ